MGILMLLEFLTKYVKFAVRGTFHWADSISVYAVIFVPAWFWFNHMEMPKGTAGFVAACIAIILAALGALRIFCAPYFLWKEEKLRAEKLKNDLAEPVRLGDVRLQEAMADRRNEAISLLAEFQSSDIYRLNIEDWESKSREIQTIIYPLVTSDKVLGKLWSQFSLNTMAHVSSATASDPLEDRQAYFARLEFTMKSHHYGIALISCLARNEIDLKKIEDDIDNELGSTRAKFDRMGGYFKAKKTVSELEKQTKTKVTSKEKKKKPKA